MNIKMDDYSSYNIEYYYDSEVLFSKDYLYGMGTHGYARRREDGFGDGDYGLNGTNYEDYFYGNSGNVYEFKR